MRVGVGAMGRGGTHTSRSRGRITAGLNAAQAWERKEAMAAMCASVSGPRCCWRLATPARSHADAHNCPGMGLHSICTPTATRPHA